MAVNLKSRELFLKYSRSPEVIGLYPTSHTYYELERPDNTRIALRSMLSRHEIALLYALAKEVWSGGAIVDLGPLLGTSSWALAKGISENSNGASAAIDSFDLWRWEHSYKSYLSDSKPGGAGSLLGQWIEVTKGYHHILRPHQGDFLRWKWSGQPIAILFVDIAKSWDLNNHVVKTMFPALKPGGVLVQQDYIHWNEYWVHIEMARFRDYFEHCQFLRGATSFYKCIETPPLKLCEIPASSLSYVTQVDLLESERELAPHSIAQVMLVAAAKHAMENQDLERAQTLLNDVNLEPLTDNPLHEVSGIAKSNFEAANKMLAQLEYKLHI